MAIVKAKAHAPWSLKVRNLSTRADGDVFEMVINGLIGASLYDESCTASNEFRSQFNARPKASQVHVRVNSDGGSVKDALGIFNICNDNRAVVTTFNDGYALSSASVVMCGGGRAVSPDASIWMIHEPWSGTVGDESDHLKAAEMLAKHGETLAGIYAKRMGTTPASMRALMKKETWYTGAEARAIGLADEIEVEELDDTQDTRNAVHFAGVFAKLDLDQFENVPQRIRDHVSNSPRRVSTPAMAAGAPADSRAETKISVAVTKQTPGVAGNKESMFKAKMVAALQKAGINIAADATDEVIFAAYDKLDGANVDASALAEKSKSDVQALRTQLESEKRVRISAEVTRRAENKIETKNLAWWVTQAVADEAGVLAQIDALPVNRPGGEPLGVSVSVPQDRFENIRKEPLAAKRYEAVRADWTNLYGGALALDQRQRQNPMAANTYSSTLITNFLLDGCVTKLQNRWAALRSFSRDFSIDRYKPRATGQLKKVTAGGTVQTNATNFESGNSTVTNVQIAVDQYSAAFNVTNDELNSGLRMDNLVDVNVAALADKIMAVAFAPLATASFTSNAAIVSDSTSFSFTDMALAWGRLKKSPTRSAILDGEYLARILNNPAFFQAAGTESGEGWNRFGWDGVHLNTNWTGTHAGADDQYIRGLFCNPQCLGVIAGLPLSPPNIPGAIMQESTIQVPGVDINVAAYSWFSTASRTMWMSYDLMFGAALVDESAGVLLTSQ